MRRSGTPPRRRYARSAHGTAIRRWTRNVVSSAAPWVGAAVTSVTLCPRSVSALHTSATARSSPPTPCSGATARLVTAMFNRSLTVGSAGFPACERRRLESLRYYNGGYALPRSFTPFHRPHSHGRTEDRKACHGAIEGGCGKMRIGVVAYRASGKESHCSLIQCW